MAFATVIGYVVIASVSLTALSAAWKLIGDLLWSKAMSSPWKQRGMGFVDGKLHFSRSRFAVMIALGGPFYWLSRLPGSLSGRAEIRRLMAHGYPLIPAQAYLEEEGNLGGPA